MKIELDVGGRTSIYQVIGGDQVDRIVGANPKGIILSEWPLTNPMTWKLLRPVLEANNGWAMFIYTPRGRNHGWKTLKTAQENGWYWEVLPIDKTSRGDGSPIVSEEQYKQIVKEEVAEGGDGNLAEQEYKCSFNAPMSGSYYGKEMDAAAAEGRICELRWERELPVHTGWDLGVASCPKVADCSSLAQHQSGMIHTAGFR